MSNTSKTVAWTVSEFATKSFVKRAQAAPNRIDSVIYFFYGVDYFNTNNHNDDAIQQLKDGSTLPQVQPLWFSGGSEYDTLCQSFVPTIRAVGQKKFGDNLLVGDEKQWNQSVDGCISQIILCDQLSRNCFRGTKEAFQYDDRAINLATLLSLKFLKINQDSSSSSSSSVIINGDIYTAYIPTIIFPMLHSESLEKHNLGMSVLNKAATLDIPNIKAKDLIMGVQEFLADHKAVVEKFGRYPHRNDKMNRQSTPEELAWLADTENLPGWVKSQE